MTQPSGIKAFGWGLLGYIGANLIINFSTTLLGMTGTGMGGDPSGNGGHFFGFILGMTMAGAFANSRDYKATATGAWVAFALATLGFIAGFLGAYNGY